MRQRTGGSRFPFPSRSSGRLQPHFGPIEAAGLEWLRASDQVAIRARAHGWIRSEAEASVGEVRSHEAAGSS